MLGAGWTIVGAASSPNAWRDLNHNGRLDPYEDTRLSPERRTEDLLARMTVEEKVGTMLHGTLPTDGDVLGHAGKGYDLAETERLIAQNHVSSFITRLAVPPTRMAEQNNAVQTIAARSRLGIPITISTDPRNHFQAVLGASTAGGSFSMWPETLGFAALGDPATVRAFGDYARREYRAVGIHMALSPQADLATEPRWARATATFGSDPKTVSALAGAYVEGFQHGIAGVAKDGVATVVKHWVGYGAEPDGYDGHNYYGRTAHHSDASFAQHVAAFAGPLAAHAEGVMPTYVIPQGVTLAGRPLEPIGAGFNRQLLTGLLRQQHGYRGLLLSDWAITNDCAEACQAPTAANPQRPADIGMPWGAETLSKEDRFVRGALAGLDQFGGVNDPAPLLHAVRTGRIPAARLDDAVRRTLLLKFRLGLFDESLVDAAGADAVINDPAAHAAADAAQRAAQVVLENCDGLLPLAPARRLWLHGVDPVAARAAGFAIADDPAHADVALVRVATPSEKLHPYAFFGSRQHEGRLDFRDGDPDYQAILRASAAVPTIVAIDMDRPAILTNVRTRARAILALFGASDAALLDVIAGKATPRGHLPFDLPSSMAEVEAQDPALPDDTAHPLYRRGAGVALSPTRCAPPKGTSDGQ